MVEHDDDIFNSIASLKKSVKENRFESVGQLLNDIDERVTELQAQRLQQNVTIDVKHVDVIEYNIDTHESFIAYQSSNKTKYGTGNSMQSAVIDFAESYLDGDF